MIALNIRIPNLYPFLATQVGLPKAKKTFIIIFTKYFNYINLLSSKLTPKLSKYTCINNNTTKLEKYKQSFYNLIYNLKSIEKEILKAYIKTNIANGFIKLFI